MPIVEIKTKGFQCERCGHQWVPLDINKEPRVCPKCKSPYWNTKRKRDLKSKVKEDKRIGGKNNGK
jgi:predicted Zn-ribbon and HTH transcriptional regulator